MSVDINKLKKVVTNPFNDSNVDIKKMLIDCIETLEQQQNKIGDIHETLCVANATCSNLLQERKKLELEIEELKNPWISVENPPKNNAIVDVITKEDGRLSRHVDIIYLKDVFTDVWSMEITNVTHWQPLPNLPQEVNKNERQPTKTSNGNDARLC